jgi:hypothetical protein
MTGQALADFSIDVALQELLAGDVDLDAWALPCVATPMEPFTPDELLGGDDFGHVVRGVQPVIRHVSVC